MFWVISDTGLKMSLQRSARVESRHGSQQRIIAWSRG